MTREEAIQIPTTVIATGDGTYYKIKALKQKPTTDERKKALRELKQEYRHHQYNNSDSCYGWSTSFKQAVAIAIKCLSADERESEEV